MKSLFAVVSLLIMLSGCGPLSDRISIADPPPPPYEPSAAELECLDFSSISHPDVPMLEAAPQSLRGAAFGKLVAEVATLDFFLRDALAAAGGRDHTLFLPSDESWNAFLERHPEVRDSQEKQLLLVREHVVLDRISYRDVAEGRPRSSNLNSRSVPFTKEVSGCFFLDQTVGFLLVDDFCEDGVIHVIDAVLVPEGW